MANYTVQHISSLFQELDLQLRDLESLSFQTYIANTHVRDTWREIMIAHNQHLATI